jgi:hypothetical protein
VTKLTFTNLSMVANTTNAAKAGGFLIYTLPAGAIIIDQAYMSVGITGAGVANNASTPDTGLGTTIATGANAVLSYSAGCENIMTGQTVGDCVGTALTKTLATTLAVEAADPHIVHLNTAATWAGVDTLMKATGTVELKWTFFI